MVNVSLLIIVDPTLPRHVPKHMELAPALLAASSPLPLDVDLLGPVELPTVMLSTASAKVQV